MGPHFSQATQPSRTLLLSQTISYIYKRYLKGIPFKTDLYITGHS